MFGRSGARSPQVTGLFPGTELASMTAMRRLLPAGLLAFLVAAEAIAQPSTIGPGDIRCPDCALSGQKPATGHLCKSV